MRKVGGWTGMMKRKEAKLTWMDESGGTGGRSGMLMRVVVMFCWKWNEM